MNTQEPKLQKELLVVCIWQVNRRLNIDLSRDNFNYIINNLVKKKLLALSKAELSLVK